MEKERFLPWSSMIWVCMATVWYWFLCGYWWRDGWKICSISGICFQTQWTVPQTADGQWPKACLENTLKVLRFKKKKWNVLQSESPDLHPNERHFRCWRQNISRTSRNNWQDKLKWKPGWASPRTKLSVWWWPSVPDFTGSGSIKNTISCMRLVCVNAEIKKPFARLYLDTNTLKLRTLPKAQHDD